ncbi:MAG TPA: hypothetical protein VGQ22_14055 [Steroidobacteraceae bacterium]|jgi:hypothetical protein|nr:hypothetical protein [Steroidobacteraceae bacterium]
MIHAGAAEYYAEISRRLATCDVVLFEGVRSPQSWLLTRSYAIAARRKRLGLVLQSDGLDYALVKSRGVHADVSAEQFAAAWAKVPVVQRLAILTFAPLYGVWVFLTGTRESIGRRMSTEEVESNKDVDFLESMPEFQEALVASRDAKLVEDLSSAVERNGANKRIAVIYGAGHMRAVSRLLTGKYQYRVVESEWITVFGYG